MNVSIGISLPINIQQPLKNITALEKFDMGIWASLYSQNISVFTVRVSSVDPSPQHTMC